MVGKSRRSPKNYLIVFICWIMRLSPTHTVAQWREGLKNYFCWKCTWMWLENVSDLCFRLFLKISSPKNLLMHDFVDICEFLLSKNYKNPIITLSTRENIILRTFMTFLRQFFYMEIWVTGREAPRKKLLLNKLGVFWCFWGLP